MMIKKIFLLTLISLSFLGCQNVREGLSFKKKKNLDEFLIQKKNPLVLPPKFSELPKPISEIDKQIDSIDNIDISKVLGNTKKEAKDIKGTNSSNDLERSIFDILNKK